MCNIFLQYRKVVSSRPVYYSIFEHFQGATNQGSLYRRAAIQFLNFVGGVTNRDVLLLTTLRYASSVLKHFVIFFFIDVGYTYNLELISEKSPFSTQVSHFFLLLFIKKTIFLTVLYHTDGFGVKVSKVSGSSIQAVCWQTAGAIATIRECHGIWCSGTSSQTLTKGA